MKSSRTKNGATVAVPVPVSDEDAFRESEQRYQGLLEISGGAVVVVGALRIVFASMAACELLGVPSPEPVLGRQWLEFVHPDDRTAVSARLGEVACLGQTAGFAEQTLLTADGAAKSVEFALHGCSHGGKPAIQVLMRDLAERRRLEARANHLAAYDALTELANRSHYRALLEGAIARASRNKQLLGILCLGLDHFRAINDAFGQKGGDQLLKLVAERLKNIVRKSDSIGRLGGDEFSVILEGLVHEEGAAIAAQRQLEQLSQPYTLDGSELPVTFSIGIAIFPLDSQDVDELLGSAILAMQHAKKNGRNKYQFYSAELVTQERNEVRFRAEVERRIGTLTPREREVLDLLLGGNASKMVAYQLGISARTVDIHRARVMEKMQAGSLAELVHMSRELKSGPARPATGHR